MTWEMTPRTERLQLRASRIMQADRHLTARDLAIVDELLKDQAVSNWITQYPEQTYEMHMRAEVAKTHGVELAFSQEYQPRQGGIKTPTV